MAGRNGHSGGVMDLAELLPKAPQDPRLSRIKLFPIDLPILCGFLSLDGTTVIKTEGWPLDGQVMGMSLRQVATPDGRHIDQVVLVVHHPDFPVVLGPQPPEIGINISGTKLEDLLHPPEPEA